MAKVKVLKDNELIGGIDNVSVYPVTHTKAIFDSNNKELDQRLNENDIERNLLHQKSEEIIDSFKLLNNRVDNFEEDIIEQYKNIKDFKEVITNQVNNYKPIIINGNVNNAADEEDLHSNPVTGLISLADRSALNGMGYIILRKNKSFAEQVTKENTIYEIRYEFNIETTDNIPIILPNNIILKFTGGKLKNGVIKGNKTVISADLATIFNNVQLVGSWGISEIYPEWFGAKSDGVTDSTQAIQLCINTLSNNTGGIVKLQTGIYKISDTLWLMQGVSIVGSGIAGIELSGTIIYCEFTDTIKWAIDTALINNTNKLETKAEYNDIFYTNISRDIKNAAKRQCSIKLANFCINANTIIYGAIREYGNLQGSIEDIYIQNVYLGICITESWNCLISHCYVRSITGGYCFGPSCTALSILDCYHSKRNKGVLIPTLPILPDNVYPEFENLSTDELKKGYTYNFLLYNAAACFYSPIVEGANIMCTGNSYSATFYSSHVEDTNSACWLAGIPSNQFVKVQFIGKNGGGFNAEQTSKTFMYGSTCGVILIDNFFAGRCYTKIPISSSNLTSTYRFVFKNCNDLEDVYYDFKDTDEESGITTYTKNPFKYLELPDYIWAHSGSKNDNKLGIDSYKAPNLYEELSRPEYIKKSFYLASLPDYTGFEFKDIDIKLHTVVGINWNIYAPIKVINSSIIVITNSTAFSGSHEFYTTIKESIESLLDLCGENKLNFSENWFYHCVRTISNVFKISGDTNTIIYVDNASDIKEFHENRDIKSPLRPTIINPNTSYKYSIKFVHTSTGRVLDEYTNIKGNTDNRPVLSEKDDGFEFYDSTLKKKILWIGTAWVNLDGTELQNN